MPPLLRDLLRPYRRTLAMILVATLVSMVMSLAVPWPLKVILDNVVASHHPPAWIAWLLPMVGGTTKPHIAAAAGIATVAIAVVSGAAFYVASYFTEKLGQNIGNDLRVRLYHHLQQLSLAYYDHNRIGTVLSTLTTDVQTIQSFASTSTLNILTDLLTLVAMVVVMLLLRWDFALIALAVTPVLTVFLVRVNRAIKTAVTEVRTKQSDLLSTLQEGLQSIEVVQAYSREDYEVGQVRKVSEDTVMAWLNTRRLSAILSPVVSVVIAVCTGLVLWRGALLILTGAMTAGVLTVFLAYLARFFQPVRALSSDDQHAGPSLGGVSARHRGVRRRQRHPRSPLPARPTAVQGQDHFRERLVRIPRGCCRCYATSRSRSAPGRWWVSSDPLGAGKSTPGKPDPTFPGSVGRPDHDRWCRHRRLQTAWTTHPDRLRVCRTPRCCGEPSATTSRSAVRRQPTRKSSTRPNWPTPTSSSAACPTDTPAWSGTAVRHCPAVSGNGSGSLVHWFATTQSSYSTSQRRHWMPSPSIW